LIIPNSGSSESPSSHLNISDTLNCRLKLLADHCQNFKGAIPKKSVVQLITTLMLFFSSLSMMVVAFENHYWLTLLLILPTGGLVVRLFIFQHDCGHHSFFKSRNMNDRVGRFLSIFTWTPYSYWRESHNIHHANSGNLCKRGIGDIDTLTVKEYQNLTLLKKISYRLYRHPIIMLLIGGPVMIIILQRFPVGQPIAFAKIWKSIMGLNLALIITYSMMIFGLGIDVFLMVYVPVLFVATWAGGWLFFVQHQFENTDWKPQEDWNFKHAAVLGSSHYDLPKILQWFSGNIGFHHLHHMSGVIPNYRLQECHETAPIMPEIRKIKFWQSLKCFNLTLWDEDLQKLVGFKHLKYN
jgi:acyl-lipid omega-6 desaturase (Delta-12 desaturase)